MEKKKPKTYAAMVKDEEDIRKNSMKLYSYLLCIAGKEPSGAGRIFQQKNLICTQIKKCTGLDSKTIKLYLYELEKTGLIQFKGKEQFMDISEMDYQKPNGKLDKIKYRKAKEIEAFRVWKLRNKAEYYRIPRPERYTPIPEITLDKLNKVFQLNEIELKTYILCCTYRDIQVDLYGGLSKQITYENMRESLGKVEQHINLKIKKSLYLLKGLGLIDFKDGYYINCKGAKIECFQLTEVNYYVTYNQNVWDENNEINSEIIKEAKNRLEQFNKDDFLF